MKTRGFDDKVRNFQVSLYQNLRRHHEIGRFAALPIAILDVTATIGGVSAKIIANLALVPINAAGSYFSKKYSLKDAGKCFTKAVKTLPQGFVLVAASPVLIACQTLNILRHPRGAGPAIERAGHLMAAFAFASSGSIFR